MLCHKCVTSQNGEEIFWSVASDDVTALTFCDLDGDGKPELILGLEDSHIKLFKDTDILIEIAGCFFCDV